MADATTKNSGYLTTATAVTWASGQDFTSLLDNEYTVLTDEIDNSTNKYAFFDWELQLGSAAFTGISSGIEIFIVRSVDGSTYPGWTGDTATNQQGNSNYMVDFAPTSGATAAQVISGGPLAMPQGKFKFGFRNRSDATLASSGNSFKWRPHGYLADE